MLACMALLGRLIGGVIGLLLFLVGIRIVQRWKQKEEKDKELRQKHLANCEVCRNHRADQFVGTS